MYTKIFTSLFQWKFACLFGILLTVSNVSLAQQQTITVSGTVTDSTDASGLIGVSVKVQGANQGVQTDASGKYSIVVAPNATLSFQYIGFRTRLINVEGNTSINVALSSESNKLNEVVVVAYGTQKKASVTGAINTIQTKEI